jgi:Conserved mid region of cactin
MMVVCKDRLDRIQTNERMGVEAAAAVESDISTLLSGKTYNDLVALQRRIQEKLTSGEPVDTDYWEGLLKKLLVWKAKVSRFCRFGNVYTHFMRIRLNSRIYTKLLFAIDSNN